MASKNTKTNPDSFKERVQEWATKVRVKPKQIRIQKMTRKWASCSTTGWVSFNEDLLWQSKDFQDYVIVHELLHLKTPNHGKLFKSFMTAHLPDWKRYSEESSLSLSMSYTKVSLTE